MRSNCVAIFRLVQPGFQKRVGKFPIEVAVILGNKIVVSLSFHVFKGCEEHRKTQGVFDKGEAPTRNNTLGANLAELASAIFPHGLVSTVENFTCFESD